MQQMLGSNWKDPSPLPSDPESSLIDWAGRKDSERKIIACVDRSNMELRVARHAQVLAGRLEIPLVLAQVLEPASGAEGPQDPVQWSIRRNQSREQLESLNKRLSLENSPDQVLLEGRAADELSSWVAGGGFPFLALATHTEDHLGGMGLGSTAHRILEIAPASLLLIPPTAPAEPVYSRILVPLDGSCRAESVLPTVASLARSGAAKVLVVHSVPQPQITQIGPLEPDAITLRDQLVQRNERVARSYLDRISRSLSSTGIETSALLLQGDAREDIQRVSSEQHADLIVMAAHGQTGRVDMPCGSVASYLVTHSAIPLLVIRNDEEGRISDQPRQEYCSLQFR